MLIDVNHNREPIDSSEAAAVSGRNGRICGVVESGEDWWCVYNLYEYTYMYI